MKGIEFERSDRERIKRRDKTKTNRLKGRYRSTGEARGERGLERWMVGKGRGKKTRHNRSKTKKKNYTENGRKR